MKSQSLEVLSEIRKTLSVLSIQIEKLSAALGGLEGADDGAVSGAKEPGADFSFEYEDLPEKESRREGLGIADEVEDASAVAESEESPEDRAALPGTEESTAVSEAGESLERAFSVTEVEESFEGAVAVPETEDLPESVSGSVFDFEEVDAAVADEFDSASAAEPIFEADDVPIDEPSIEEMPVPDTPARENIAASPAEEMYEPVESSPFSPHEEIPASGAAPELEAVDLSRDIEVDTDEMRLPDVHDLQWMIDIPGSKVANVISAISLNDRVLLINTLFKENPELFQQTISKFNNMESLSEAISYVLVTFPEWNLNSDVVYRLMMAVRRKLE